MNALDSSVISLFGHFANLSVNLNRFLFSINEGGGLTWLPLTTALWWAWFKREDAWEKNSDRESTCAIVVSCVLVAAAFFVLQESPLRLPFHPRPMFDPRSGFQVPYGIELPGRESYWGMTSSFPSGHAAILAAISAGLLQISRPLGSVSVAFALLICGLRVLFGFHSATDILVGAVMGIAILRLAKSHRCVDSLIRPVLRWSNYHPGMFYAILFAITFEITTGFIEARTLIQVLHRLRPMP
jgi:undecaprenyl-diphosphatase